MLNFVVQGLRLLVHYGLSGSKEEPEVEWVLDEELLNKTIQQSLNTLEKFDKQRERDLVLILRNESGNIAAQAALATPPLNGTSKKDAEENIKSDINLIFRPLEDIPFAELVLAKQWPAVTAYNFEFKSDGLRKAYEDGNWEKIYDAFYKNGQSTWSAYSGPDINLVKTPSSKFHKMGRDKDGRLNKRRFHVTGTRDDAQAKIDEYVHFAASAIGQMAGGWVSCYVKLEGTGYSLPLDYATKGKGYVKTKWWGEDKEVEIRNNLGNFGGFIDQRRAKFNAIVDSAALRVQKRHVQNTNKLISMLKMK